jgi:pyruvate kinase
MNRVCVEAEKEIETPAFAGKQVGTDILRVDEAIAKSAAFTALHLNVKAIAAMTQSGSTALWISRISTHVPIYALTPEVDTRRKVTLYRGVYPVNFKPDTDDRDVLLSEAEDELRRRGAVRNGDLILLTIGEPIGRSGGTNTMKIVRVGERKKH